MSKTDDRLDQIRAKLDLPPQKWKMNLADHMIDQKLLLDTLGEALAALSFYAAAPEGSILYWSEEAQDWVEDSGQKARDALAHIEEEAGER